MKAVLCEQLDGPESLVYRDIPDPEGPNADQIRVSVQARSISFTDILMSKGEYQVKPPLPFIVGGEGVGEVIEVGADVNSHKVGDKVMVGSGCVEQVVIDAVRATPIPAHVDYAAAASYRSNYSTALYALQRGRLQEGENLLVHGAAGGVGLAAVDVGKLLGARVIGTASTDEKLKIVSEMGADHVINYTNGFRERVKELTEGKGADVIYDPVGGDVFDESMRCIAPFGRILIVGFTSGRAALAKTNHLLIKDAELVGFTIGGLMRHAPEWSARNQEQLLTWLGDGSIHPYVSHRFPMSQVSDGLRVITERKVIGKVLIEN